MCKIYNHIRTVKSCEYYCNFFFELSSVRMPTLRDCAQDLYPLCSAGFKGMVPIFNRTQFSTCFGLVSIEATQWLKPSLVTDI